jgi:hypothetical protein
MPFMLINVIHVVLHYMCQLTFLKIQYSGGGGEGGQIRLPRPSVTAWLSGRWQKLPIDIYI